MATADQLKALIRSHATGDSERFYTIALQVAAQAARNGHTRFAQQLRDLVDESRRRATAPAQGRMVPLVRPRGELAGLLTASFPKTRLADLALDDKVRLRIERVLLEQRQKDRILAHGLTPIRKLLLIGPPGTGKTTTAGVLAGELALPLFSIQLHGLITKYLGETAAKLRLIFDAMREVRGVYLFDEFDALGGERAAKNEVGEIRRVLNSFLQFLELDESESIVVAATNHPRLLDHALFRRFDAVIEYPTPSQEIAERVMKSRLAILDTTQLDWTEVSRAAVGLSHADLARASEQAAKKTILSQRKRVETEDVVEALRERGPTHD